LIDKRKKMNINLLSDRESKKTGQTVFVSGCFDILHAGHLQFFREARALGDHLTVSFASADVLFAHKQRLPSIPDQHKTVLLESLEMVDQVVVGKEPTPGLDFKDHFVRLKPDILAITTDSEFTKEKAALCKQTGAKLVTLEKSPPDCEPISTSQIIRKIQVPIQAPLRVDFAGGWLDVPKFSIEGEYIVNCAIAPLVSLHQWDYKAKSGLGGSGAWSMLNGKDGVIEELNLGVGWQDPAVIQETGCCVWRSGQLPVLDFKRNGDFLSGLMGLAWTGNDHDTPSFVDNERDFQLIAKSARIARVGVLEANVFTLADGIKTYYSSQINEGMKPLPDVKKALACKYCGGGFGGYALYLFGSKTDRDAWVGISNDHRAIEPWCK